MDIIKNVVGTDIEINDSNGDRIVDIELQGDTIQNGTPTPDSPVEVETVTGRQEVNIKGDNVLNNITWITGKYLNSNNEEVNNNGWKHSDYIDISGGNYIYEVGNQIGNAPKTLLYDSNKNVIQVLNITSNAIYNLLQYNAKYIRLSSAISTNISSSLYIGKSYEINLGKNLFDKDNTNSINAYMYKDTMLFVSSSTVKTYYISCQPNTTYTIQKVLGMQFRVGTSANIPVVNGTLLQQWQNNNATRYTITTDKNAKYLCINIHNSSTDTLTEQEILNTIQIEKGSEASSYSAYKTPIELCKINTCKDRIFKSTGKNLINMNIFKGTSQYLTINNSNSCSVLSKNPSAYMFYRKNITSLLQVGKTYTISFETNSTYYGDINIDEYNGDTRTLIAQRSITILEGRQYYLNVYANKTNSAYDGTLNLNYWNIQLEEGSISSEFEPHGINWYIEKNIGKVVLDGSESWIVSNQRYFLADIIQGKTFTDINIPSAYSDYFKWGNGISTNFVNGAFWYTTNGRSLSMQKDANPTNTTLATFKTWLSTHNTTVYYVLATPTYEKITDEELISQLNELGTALLPYGVVNISVSSNDLPTTLDIDYFNWNRYISPTDRQALLHSIATIPYKINIIKDGTVIKTLDEHSIVNVDYEDFRYVDTNTLVIGQFVGRKITGELDQIYTDFEIEDTELNIQMGIRVNNNTNYYDLGNFLVTKPINNNVKDKTTFDAMDYTKKFNKIFDGTKLTYPCTAKELALECCRQADVELATDIFTNSDFIIDSNQYVENETCRKVMQDIGKLAYSWIRIDWDNKCYIDFDPQDYVINDNKITNHEYYDLSLQNNVFGPVNRVVIGIQDVEGENIVIEDSDSISENGVTEIRIYDNNITYTPELRQQAIEKASKLFGLTYTPLETNTIGHPWLIGKEKIQVTTMEGNNVYTYPFDRTIAYEGHIKSKLTSKADTKIETEYKNTGDIETAIRQTRIIVDKQNGTISSVVSTANTALSTANTANSTATTAQSTANTANTNANTALSTASSASSDASNALSTANIAEEKADAAAGMASDASTAAGNAMTRANEAYSNAGNASQMASAANDKVDDLIIEIPTVFATKSELTQTSNSITATVEEETSRGKIVSKINLIPGEIKLEGTVTANNNFKVLSDGSIEAKNGSFSGDIFLGSGGKVIGGDGLLTNLQFTSVGIIDGWSPLGFNIDDSNNVLYQDLYVDYNIPSNFTVKEAYLTLYTSRVMSSYINVSNYQSVSTTGTPKQLKLYKGVLDQTRQVFWANGTSYFYRGNLSLGNEISSAFGSTSYTPSISGVGQVASVTSIDLKNSLSTDSGNNQLVVRTAVTKPSNFNTTANRQSIAENTGMARMVLNIIGYMSTSA